MEAIELDPTDAPLADLDETEDSVDFSPEESHPTDNTQLCPRCAEVACLCLNDADLVSEAKRKQLGHLDTFDERFSDSIEDLVNCFDQKISNCFKPQNYTRKTEDIAPVQVRSEEEIMEECQ